MLDSVAILEPSIALRTCENALRQLMGHVYQQAYGTNWLEQITNGKQRKEWQRRADQENEKRATRGVAAVPNVGLIYSDFSDLVKFVSGHWAPLEAALHDKDETHALLKRFDSLRNSVAHDRNLLSFEEELLSGIATQIRNQVTIYMSTQDTTGNYYPRIESIIDGFGHAFQGTAEVKNPLFYVNTGKVLHPDDTVTFVCVAIDPQGRDLSLRLTRGMNIATLDEKISSQGRPVELKWQVSKKDVAQTAEVGIVLSTVDAEYHRFGVLQDQAVLFQYRVDPPVVIDTD